MVAIFGFGSKPKASRADTSSKARMRSFRTVKLPKGESSVAPADVWTNKDLDPTTPEERIWSGWTYLLYWSSDIITVSGWQKASSMISLGLDWRNALGITVLGSCLLAVPMIMNGAIGARLHIPFPIVMRASMGYYFAYFAIVSRVIIAFFWFGIQAWNGGTAVKLAIGAIWPSFNTLENQMPESAGFTTSGMTAYIIYWLIQLPILFIPAPKLKYLFLVKSILVPIVGFATLGWCVAKAGGGGPLLQQEPTVQGSAFASAWLLSLTSLIGGYSTVALNIPDFTRYAKKPASQLMQAPTLPLFYLLTAAFGIFSASSTLAFTGSVIWSPIDIAATWDSRAAQFFAAVPWILAQISNNVSANSVSAANDLATLFPKYVDITRGQIICAVIGGWAMVPWKVLADASTFLHFISSYAIFLAPLAGIELADYYIVKRKNYDVPGLYDPHGRYRYSRGCNWRAIVTLICTVAPNMPGMINYLNSSVQIGNISWVYSVSWIFGFTTSIAVYSALNWVFPDKTGSVIDHTVFADDYIREREATSSATPSMLDETKQLDDDVKAPTTAVLEV